MLATEEPCELTEMFPGKQIVLHKLLNMFTSIVTESFTITIESTIGSESADMPEWSTIALGHDDNGRTYYCHLIDTPDLAPLTRIWERADDAPYRREYFVDETHAADRGFALKFPPLLTDQCEQKTPS